MKPGLQRLSKRIDSKDYTMDEFLEDTRIMASESPEMADILKRMIQGELDLIEQAKNKAQHNSEGVIKQQNVKGR